MYDTALVPLEIVRERSEMMEMGEVMRFGHGSYLFGVNPEPYFDVTVLQGARETHLYLTGFDKGELVREAANYVRTIPFDNKTVNKSSGEAFLREMRTSFAMCEKARETERSETARQALYKIMRYSHMFYCRGIGQGEAMKFARERFSLSGD